jgi:hypothetical protein
MSVIATAIHQIVGKDETVEPGQTFEVTVDRFTELEKLGAARAANADEKALLNLSKGQAELALVKPVVEPTPTGPTLLERAEAVNLKVDKRWSEARLLEEVIKAEAAVANPDPEVKEI